MCYNPLIIAYSTVSLMLSNCSSFYSVGLISQGCGSQIISLQDMNHCSLWNLLIWIINFTLTGEMYFWTNRYFLCRNAIPCVCPSLTAVGLVTEKVNQRTWCNMFLNKYCTCYTENILLFLKMQNMKFVIFDFVDLNNSW